jgi:hypothetical protein
MSTPAAPPTSTSPFVFLYKCIYGTTPFPFWFLVHAFWSLHLVHRSGRQPRQTFRNRLRILFLSSVITFVSRELLAFALKKRSPIMREPLSAVVFMLIYVVLEFSPGNRVADFCNKFLPAIAFLEGLAQFKLFTICLRNIGGSSLAVLLYSLFFGTFDLYSEYAMRWIMQFKAVPLTGFLYWTRTLATFVVYWIVTRENVVTHVIGVMDVIRCAVVIGILHGLANAYFTRSAKREEKRSGSEKALKSV